MDKFMVHGKKERKRKRKRKRKRRIRIRIIIIIRNGAKTIRLNYLFCRFKKRVVAL
jgi:hypothetical protein